MSYAMSAALQEAVFTALTGNAALAALVGTAIYDAPPSGSLPVTYVALGPEEVRDRSDVTGAGAEHDLTVSVISSEAGFRTAKRSAAAISDVLNGAGLTMSRGTLVSLVFLKARAVRADKAGLRRIDLIFRARVAE